MVGRKGVDWDPFEEEKSDEKLREDYNIEAEVVLDDAIKPLRERLYRILDILLGKVISLQEGILKVRDILSINKEIQLTRAVKDFLICFFLNQRKQRVRKSWMKKY